MEPWHCDDRATIYHGDCLEVLRELPDASVDSVVTDPPYGLEFMGKEWDRFGKPRDPRTAGRSGEGAVVGGAAVKADGGKLGARVSFGGKRSTTWRCDSCHKRDQFRAHSAKVPDCQGTWRLEVIDPDAPSPLLGFQLWSQEWAAEALRVLKPGGHLLAFGGTRTWHRLAVAVEDAGFEVRDSIAWLYGSGFPKSLDVSKAIDKAAGAERTQRVGVKPGHEAFVGKDNLRSLRESGSQAQEGGFSRPWMHDPEKVEAAHYVTAPATPDAARWSGWGTALKPAFEPVVVARKPLMGTVAANVLEHGVGGLNIDGCRIGTDAGWSYPNGAGGNGFHGGPGRLADGSRTSPVQSTSGRWPANVVLDEDQADALDKQSGNRPGFSTQRDLKDGRGALNGIYGAGMGAFSAGVREGYNDTGGASRFFYVAKAPARERPKVDGIAHPTVKPLTLMRWLCRLVTPPGGTVLEPFAGSGTTIEAALMEGFRVVAIEREDDYLPLIAARLERVGQEPDGQLTFDASA